MPYAISGHTRLLAVVADPVSQARTPGLANAWLERRGLSGVYVLVPMQVAADAFPALIEGIRGIRNFCGAVVSMPHKIAASTLMDELTAEARLVGAVNVVRRTADGRLVGALFDGEGFVAGLRNAGHQVAGANVLLAGAGGAASAIAFALAKHGCAALCIRNRSGPRAEALAARVGAAFPQVRVSTEAEVSGTFDLAINATSLGMRPGDDLPFPANLVRRCELVAECVVAPEMTELLRLSAALGKRIHTGVPMLAAQLDLMLAFMGVE